MTKTTPELAPPLQTSASHQRAHTRQGAVALFNGIGFRTWNPPAPKLRPCHQWHGNRGAVCPSKGAAKSDMHENNFITKKSS
ncbi:hypothetical protein AVEN_130932-1 [Araneus ventricosus]|uniref:Uncharacterized protein n=1 Tax=Araneus ventricosus TaxID=182803 RepID=A0A4Y2FP92_ARAVE|nr:hypothetical protein AVEN_130932-1 [Araneus ventricosus]